MTALKVCFVGIGSIAKRHIKNLHTVCAGREIELTVDAFRRSTGSVEGVRNIYSEINCVPDDYDAIFITNPTDRHLDTLKAFHEKGKHFFIEKPVVALNQVDDAKGFDIRQNSVYYVAAPLRYNAVIKWIKDNVNPDDIITRRNNEKETEETDQHGTGDRYAFIECSVSGDCRRSGSIRYDSCSDGESADDITD